MNVWIRVAVVSLLLGLGACKDDKHSLYALTSTGKLIGFESDTPTDITSEVTISGLNSDESVVQIDYRASNSTLYGITSENRVVTLDPGTGLATSVSSSSFTSDTLSTVTMSVDPVSDLIRVISSSENQLVSPSSGELSSTQTAVDYDDSDTNSDVSPNLVAIAYSDHQSGASTTTLYAIDVKTLSLVRVGSEGVSSTTTVNQGLLHTIGELGVSFSSNVGFTVEPSSGDGYAALAQSGAASALYTIDLSTGTASKVDTIGDGDRTIISIAASP